MFEVLASSEMIRGAVVGEANPQMVIEDPSVRGISSFQSEVKEEHTDKIKLNRSIWAGGDSRSPM